MEKELFWSTSMFDGWPCSYWPSYLNCERASCDGYNLPQLLASSHSSVHHNNCLLWVDRECLSVGTRLSCPSTPQPSSPLFLTRMSPRFSLSVLGLRALGMLFYVVSQSHKKFFSVPSHHIGQGRKRGCPCTVYGQILLHPLSD